MMNQILVFISIVIPAMAKAQKLSAESFFDSVFKSQTVGPSPGIAVTVIQEGAIQFRKDYGMANLEHKAAFTHETPVRLGYSGAREFMCAGLALMESEGLLNFGDKVKTYFPNLPVWSAGVTIQDLLNHSSGFDDEWATMLLTQAHMNNRVDKEQLLTLLYNQPKPQVEPGKGYMYSNSDFALLRLIMEKAANKKLPDYLHEKLFAPLGMSSTFINDDLEQLIPGLADKYYGESRYLKSFGVKTSPGGNYRIVTTAADLEKWALALEDPQSIAAKAMLRLYRNARPIPVLSPEVHYTFGHEWQKIGETEVIKHGGVNHDFYMVRIPTREITIIGLGNSNSNMTKAMSLADFYLGFKPGKVEKPPAISAQQKAIGKTDLAKYAGKYFEQKKPGHSSDIPGIQFYDIRCEGDNLNFYYAGNEYFTLMPVGNDLFKDPDFGTIFQFIDPHPDSLMRMQAWPADGSPTLKYVRAPSATNYSTAYLRQFTGRYYSRHLDFYCSIVLNDSNLLVLRRPTIADKPLVTYGTDRFIFEMESGSDSWYVMATFSRNAEGKVDGIDMQHIRMMHHRFDKVD